MPKKILVLSLLLLALPVVAPMVVAAFYMFLFIEIWNGQTAYRSGRWLW